MSNKQLTMNKYVPLEFGSWNLSVLSPFRHYYSSVNKSKFFSVV